MRPRPRDDAPIGGARIARFDTPLVSPSVAEPRVSRSDNRRFMICIKECVRVNDL